MRLLRASLFLVVVAAACVGCSSMPRTEYYTVRCELEGKDIPQKTLDVAVCIRSFTAAEPYDGQEVVYRSSPYRLHFDYYRLWAASPDRMVRREFASWLRASGCFSRVLCDDGPSGEEYVVRGRLLEFYELDEKDARYAVVLLELTLEDPDGKPIVSVCPPQKVKAPPSKDLSGVAEAMSQALQKTFAEFVRRAGKHLDASQEGAAAQPN